jgi:hypothetical protein
MLRITVARIRIFFAVMGCAALGASLIDWAQNLRAAESGYAWVQANSPLAPAVATAEIWRASARCMRPFFVNAVLRSKATLNAYDDLVPAEVRAARTAAAGGENLLGPGQGGTYRLVSDRPDASGDAAQRERGAMLHVRYAEWYANVFKLEIEEHQWEERLGNVADQSVTVGEATRRSFTAGRGVARDDAAGDFDRNLIVLLGLGGFPADQEQALRARCVTVVPVKKVFASANYVSELWRWPLDHAAAVAFGLELLLVAIFFVPIDLWLGTGETRAALRHVGEVSARVAARLRRLAGEFSYRVFKSSFQTLRAVASATRAIFTARIDAGAPMAQIRFVAKLAELALPHRLVSIANSNGLGKTLGWLKRAGANKFDDRFARL